MKRIMYKTNNQAFSFNIHNDTTLQVFQQSFTLMLIFYNYVENVFKSCTENSVFTTVFRRRKVMIYVRLISNFLITFVAYTFNLCSCYYIVSTRDSVKRTFYATEQKKPRSGVTHIAKTLGGTVHFNYSKISVYANSP